MTAADKQVAERYFSAMNSALNGLDVFLRDDHSPLYRHGLVAQMVADYLERLRNSFQCWQNRLGFVERFRISRAGSGFPIFQNILELENDRRLSGKRLETIAEPDTLRSEMADFILRHKRFPSRLQQTMAERLYLEALQGGQIFSSFILPRTAKVSVNPKTGRPYYVVHWGAFDGSENLPMVYMASIEDSSEDMIEALVTRNGELNRENDIDFPVDGLLNPDLAHRFDDFAERNAAYSLSPSTIASNLDQDFDELHPKQLRRFVLGPFYSAGITRNNSVVSDILSRVHRPDNAWMLTWTLQEIYSVTERPERKGLWSSQPAREEFHIDTGNLEAARQGVSSYEKHALVPHEAYQALYAAGKTQEIFDDYRVHVLSNGQVVSDV